MSVTSGNPCLMAGTGTPCDRTSYHRHHVIHAQTLRRYGHTDKLYDRRNLLIVCVRHHQRLHSGHEPIPRDMLPPEVFEFAAEIGLDWWIDRRYPVNATTGGRAA